jgi:hypothetical protein
MLKTCVHAPQNPIRPNPRAGHRCRPAAGGTVCNSQRLPAAPPCRIVNGSPFEVSDGMPETPDQPCASRRRRRRRWLIAALLFVVGVTAWWYWPRGDARFVGKWSVSMDGQKPEAVMVLRSNGTGHQRLIDGSAEVAFSWSVEGDVFMVGRFSSNRLTEAIDQFMIWLIRKTGRGVFLSADRLQVVDIEDEVIRMERPGKVTAVEFHRIND